MTTAPDPLDEAAMRRAHADLGIEATFEAATQKPGLRAVMHLRASTISLAFSSGFAVGDHVQVIPQPHDEDSFGVIEEIVDAGHSTLYRVRRDKSVFTPTGLELTHLITRADELHHTLPNAAQRRAAQSHRVTANDSEWILGESVDANDSYIDRCVTVYDEIVAALRDIANHTQSVDGYDASAAVVEMQNIASVALSKVSSCRTTYTDFDSWK